jgi:5-methylcytosine-specific restriction enzyme B
MKYWIIAPYNSQEKQIFDKVWNFDIENSCIAVGWSNLGNIFRTSMNEEEYNSKYNNLFAPKSKRISTYDRKSFWQFWHDISVGDMVIARKGLKTIIGIGEVKNKAYYDENKGKARVGGLTDDYYANFIDVEWEKKEIRFEDAVFLRSTIQQILEEKYNSLTKGKMPDGMVREATIVIDNTLDLIEKKKQIILYGPPGTGKTYNTKKIAINLLAE